MLVSLIFIYAGDIPPMVNEAHYLVKAKNYWQPEWCSGDLFAASGKAHTTFYFLFGWPTLFVSLDTTAWIGRFVGWGMLAVGLQRLCFRLLGKRLASIGVLIVWIAGVEYGNLAGEWIVGGIEAKVPAFGLVLLGLAEMVDRKWHRVWPWLGAASAFHVLTGGWSVIAAMIAWVMTERGRDDAVKLFTPALFFGGALSLLGLVPAVALTVGAGSEDATAAARYLRLFSPQASSAARRLPCFVVCAAWDSDCRHDRTEPTWWRATAELATYEMVYRWRDRNCRGWDGCGCTSAAGTRSGGAFVAVLLVPIVRCRRAVDVCAVGHAIDCRRCRCQFTCRS